MSRFEIIITGILSVFFLSIIALFIFAFSINNKVNSLTSINKITNSSNLNPENNSTTNDSNKNSLTDKLDTLEASSSMLLARIEELEDQPKTKSVVNNTVYSPTKKQIIYIGSASTTNRNWTDSGVAVTLNSADYPKNVNVRFEAGISIIGGDGWARLVNTTTGAIMNITEISSNSNSTDWKTSAPFKLYSGNNTYTLQIHSTTGEKANFSGARVIIGD